MCVCVRVCACVCVWYIETDQHSFQVESAFEATLCLLEEVLRGLVAGGLGVTLGPGPLVQDGRAAVPR